MLLEAPSALRSSTWRLQAVLGAQLGGPKRSKSPTWRSKSLPRPFQWIPKSFSGPPGLWKTMLPCRRGLHFHVFVVLAFSGAFGLLLKRLGRLLGSTWRVLGASWAQLGRSWGQLGRNLGALGANLGATWAASGPSWALLGRTLGQLGCILGCLSLSKRSQQLNWRLKALRGANSGGLELSQMAISRSVASLRAQLGGARQLRNNPLMIRATRSKSIDR